MNDNGQITGLAAKVSAEGEVEAKASKESFEWRDDTSKNAQFAIQTVEELKGKLVAQNDKFTSDAQVADAKIRDLAAPISQAEGEVTNATLLRDKETAEFSASDQELTDGISALDRAVSILENEMAWNLAAHAQVDLADMAGMLQALGAVLDAAASPSSDQKQLAALVQSQLAARDEDEGVNAPAAATYQPHSGGSMEVLEDMREKAEGELSDLRKAEVSTKHNHEMLKQSLEDQLAADNRDMEEAKSAKAAAQEAAYKEYLEWCDDTSKNGQFAIQTAEEQKGKLVAQVDKLTSDAQVADAKIGDLAASISQAEGEVTNAALLRDKETAEFSASEQELMEGISTLDRGVSILEKEMAKNLAALAQVDPSDMAGMLQAAGEEDDDVNAPAAATYQSHSGGIMEVWEDMKEKAEGELSDLRKAEDSTKYNYEMLKQSLEDQLADDNKDMEEEKSAKAAAQEAKATAEGELAVTTNTLANAQVELATCHSSYMQVASDHEATVASHAEELMAIAEAKKILEETSAVAAARMQASADLAGSEVIAMVKQLAKQHHSAAMSQLAPRITVVMRYGSLGGGDPFGKVKALISDMIALAAEESISVPALPPEVVVEGVSRHTAGIGWVPTFADAAYLQCEEQTMVAHLEGEEQVKAADFLATVEGEGALPAVGRQGPEVRGGPQPEFCEAKSAGGGRMHCCAGLPLQGSVAWTWRWHWLAFSLRLSACTRCRRASVAPRGGRLSSLSLLAAWSP